MSRRTLFYVLSATSAVALVLVGALACNGYWDRTAPLVGTILGTIVAQAFVLRGERVRLFTDLRDAVRDAHAQLSEACIAQRPRDSAAYLLRAANNAALAMAVTDQLGIAPPQELVTWSQATADGAARLQGFAESEGHSRETKAALDQVLLRTNDARLAECLRRLYSE